MDIEVRDGRERRRGVVMFKREEEARKAVQAMDGGSIDLQQIVVSLRLYNVYWCSVSSIAYKPLPRISFLLFTSNHLDIHNLIYSSPCQQSRTDYNHNVGGFKKQMPGSN